ncbi:MAG: hypothetical protein K2X99_11265 [Gemmatimonadaceae bacterium]|nr:hypothetical protein [Gemmatimonadaceae bacterium]
MPFSAARTAAVRLVLLSSATAAQLQAQIIRPGAPTVEPTFGAVNAESMGRRAQYEFERFRLEHMPSSRDGRPGRCDEQVGRFCYWYDEKGPAAPPEAGATIEARKRLTAQLDSAARLDPYNRWLSGQRVRYHNEDGDFAGAIAAANECQVTGWWCDALRGFAYHEAGRFVESLASFEKALGRMPPRDRCRWRDLSFLIDDDARLRYRGLACGSPEREAYEDRVWWFAKPTYAMPGNDARTEYYARITYAEFLTDAPSAHQFGFDDDERELTLRFGWPRAWSRSGGGGGGGFGPPPMRPGGMGGMGGPMGRPMPPPMPAAAPVSVTGHERTPAYRYIPAGYVLLDPSNSDSTDWRLQAPPVIGRYGPTYARKVRILEHQKALFRRGDTALVAMAYDVRSEPAVGAAPIRAALAVTPGLTVAPKIAAVDNAPRIGVLQLRAPWGPLVMSAEVTAPDSAALIRARYGIKPPWAVGVRVTLSDLLFYNAGGELPSKAEEAIPRMLATERVRADKRLGVFWEAYGTDPAGERMKINLTVVREVEESGFLRKKAQALKLTREATPVTVGVEDMSARGSRTSARAVELDISTLKKGSYIVQLEIEVAGQYTVRADHRIEIISP